MKLSCTLMLGLLCACQPPRDADSTEDVGASEVSPREALNADREALADAQRYPVRNGIRLDGEALRRSVLALRTRHGAQVALAYDKTIDALPAGEQPPEPEFSEVAHFEPPDEPALRDVEAMNWLFDESIEQTASRALFTYLPMVMMEEGLSSAEVGMWFGFLRAAKPAVTRCSGDGKELRVCLDYGVDVFVFEMRRVGSAWIVGRLRWMQRATE